MGTISHDVILVTGYDEYVDKAREIAVEVAKTVTCPPGHPFDWSSLISPVISGVTNGYKSFFVAPDGSKEWWEHSNLGDELRQKIIEALDGDMLIVVQVRYGELGDEIQVVR